MKGKAMTEIIMPRLGLNMEKGILSKWHVSEGQAFKKDDLLCEVESEKTIGDVRAEFDGRVVKLLAAEGDELDVLAPLATVEETK